MFGSNELFKNLQQQIDNEAMRLYNKLNGMPNLKPNDNITKNFAFRSKFFFITEQTTANEYAEFMTELINNPEKYIIIREKENWTQAGELIRLVEYLEKMES